MTTLATAVCGADGGPLRSSFDTPVSYRIRVDALGKITGLELDECFRGSAPDEVLRDCVLAAVAKETFPCIPDGYLWGTICILLT